MENKPMENLVHIRNMSLAFRKGEELNRVVHNAEIEIRPNEVKPSRQVRSCGFCRMNVSPIPRGKSSTGEQTS